MTLLSRTCDGRNCSLEPVTLTWPNKQKKIYIYIYIYVALVSTHLITPLFAKQYKAGLGGTIRKRYSINNQVIRKMLTS